MYVDLTYYRILSMPLCICQIDMTPRYKVSTVGYINVIFYIVLNIGFLLPLVLFSFLSMLNEYVLSFLANVNGEAVYNALRAVNTCLNGKWRV